MYSFQEFITEGRDAPLYHGTSIFSGVTILYNNKFEPRTLHQNTKLLRGDRHERKIRLDGVTTRNDRHLSSGISLSRNKKYAAGWISGILFELDQSKLARNYKIIPINYWSTPGKNTADRYDTTRPSKTESEEFLVSARDIHPADRYITKIWLTSQFDTLDKLKERYLKSDVDGHADPEFYNLIVKYVFENPKFAGPLHY